MPDPHPLDVVDTDPTRLAARALIGRLHATVYNSEGEPPTTRSWWRWAYDEEQSVTLVLEFAHEVIERRERQRETQKGRAR